MFLLNVSTLCMFLLKAQCWKLPGHYLCISEPGRPDCLISIEIGVNGDAYPVAITPKVTKNLPVSFYSPTSGSTCNTVNGFIFVGSNFCGLNKIDTFVGFKICGHSIFLHNSFPGYWNSRIGPSTKIGTPQKLSHPQYIVYSVDICFSCFNQFMNFTLKIIPHLEFSNLWQTHQQAK